MKIDKNIIVAGLATVAGLAILTKTPVMRREAETVVFNARGFPKKVRLEQYAKITRTPLTNLFIDAKGTYCEFDYNYWDNLGRSWRTLEIGNNWNRGYNTILPEILFKVPYGGEEDNLNYEEWFYYFNKVHNKSIDDLNDELEFWDWKIDAQEQKRILNENIQYNLISKQEFEDIWDVENNGQNKNRLDAYWELYTNGTIDSDMDDEPSPLYLNLRKIFTKIGDATFVRQNVIPITEQDIYDNHMEKINKKIDSRGWGWISENWVGKSAYEWGALGCITSYVDEPKNFTKDELKTLAEYLYLRIYVMFYNLFNTNIKPLITQGWDIQKGQIIQNIRSTWDAYRDYEDVPSRRDATIDLLTEEEMEKHLFSESFITKQVLKKRPKFLMLIRKDEQAKDDKQKQENEEDAKEAILTIREIVSDKDKLGEYDGYYDISDEYEDDEDYYRNLYKENLNENIETLITRARDKMTDADRRMFKQRWKEYLEQIKYQKIQENKERIEELEKANDRIEAFMKDYKDEIDKMDLKGD